MASSKSPKSAKLKSKGKGKGKRTRKMLAAAAAAIGEEHHAVNVGEDGNRDGTDTDTNTDNAPFIGNSGGVVNPVSGGVKQLSTTAVNIKRREDYANMDPASKERERTRVKRSRAVKLARDSLAHTAWVELGQHSQVEIADAITNEIRHNYAAATPGPSSRKAAEYALHKVFADKSHLFFPKDKKKTNEHKNTRDDAAEDEDDEDEDDWTPFELGQGWQDIMSAIEKE